jgi:hypothetical protein
VEEALREYRAIVERYPSSSFYPTAVQRMALLYVSPRNPAPNDSLLAFWMNAYLAIAESPGEQQMIRAYLASVDRVKTLREALQRQTAVNDSTAVTARKAAGESAARAKRIQELETELKRVSDELQKLREIDVRISKRRGQNK